MLITQHLEIEDGSILKHELYFFSYLLDPFHHIESLRYFSR